ncbi:GNAT family N-acetyltransferase [Cribrihabitans neustonicus]|uniref:GNAT family N-acetyltransferase n=1 Tax=Cribrihabitans neustonicus TaxID=1429085 RepID=UPI003B5AC5B1
MLDFQNAGAMSRQTPPDSAPRALQQTPEFIRALRACGQQPLVLGQLDGTVVLRRRLSGGIGAAMVARARIERPAHLLDMLQEEGLRRTPVILSPEAPAPELARLGAVPLMSPAHAAVLALDPDPERRRAALHQKWRNRLKRGESQGLRLTRQNLPLDPRHWLFAADSARQAARGYRSWPIALTLAYARENKGQAKLFQAHDGGKAVAAVLILTHGSGATYHLAQATGQGKALCAPNLLLWEAMSWLAARGCRQLDLGVINTEDAPGLARFKLGTGARAQRLGGTWAYWPPLRRLLRPLAWLDRGLMGI